MAASCLRWTARPIWGSYLNGTVYVINAYHDMIYLCLSGGEDDGKYARFYTLEETNP